MNGWIRLWALTSIIWALLAGSLTAPPLYNHITEWTEQFTITEDPEDHMWQVQGCFMCGRYESVSGNETNIVVNRIHAYNMELADKRQGFITAIFFPPLVLLLFGYGVAWVRAGFRKT